MCVYTYTCIWLPESLWDLCQYALLPSSHASWYLIHNVVGKKYNFSVSLSIFSTLVCLNFLALPWPVNFKMFAIILCPFIYSVRIGKLWAVGQLCLLLIFVNKVSLKHNQAHSFLCHIVCVVFVFPARSAEGWIVVTEIVWPSKSKIVTLYRRTLLISMHLWEG